jgi:hypothetical protein
MKYPEKKICPNATLSTTNPTRTGLELNPIFFGARSATNYTVTVFMFEISNGAGWRITEF